MSSEPDEPVVMIAGDEALQLANIAVRDFRAANPDLDIKDLDILMFETVSHAYELGRTHARAESDLVDEVVQEVSDKRHAYAVQATIAAIMRAANVTEVTLRFADIEQVFRDYELRLISFDLTNGIGYRLVNRESSHD